MHLRGPHWRRRRPRVFEAPSFVTMTMGNRRTKELESGAAHFGPYGNQGYGEPVSSILLPPSDDLDVAGCGHTFTPGHGWA